jgi:putative ABC transport system substrate-binding protein
VLTSKSIEGWELAVERREFIKLVGGVAALWPLTADAQEPNIPVVGFLNAQSAENYQRQVAAFLDGLAEAGYVDGRNVKIEYRWADGDTDRLPSMVADLVDKKVRVIAATSTAAALAAKAVKTSIPIVFETSSDPVKIGLVEKLNRPGGSITGVMQVQASSVPKRLEVLHELVPNAKTIGLLVNPANLVLAGTDTDGTTLAAKGFGVSIRIFHATSARDFDAVFAKVAELGAGGLVIGSDPLFTANNALLGELAARHAVPTAYVARTFAAAGGLVSYGGDFIDSYRITGVYVARVLKGEKPADLPVQQGTKYELFINSTAAKALGISIPLPLSGRADEIIE